jgi:hypothetical protein
MVMSNPDAIRRWPRADREQKRGAPPDPFYTCTRLQKPVEGRGPSPFVGSLVSGTIGARRTKKYFTASLETLIASQPPETKWEFYSSTRNSIRLLFHRPLAGKAEVLAFRCDYSRRLGYVFLVTLTELDYSFEKPLSVAQPKYSKILEIRAG